MSYPEFLEPPSQAEAVVERMGEEFGIAHGAFWSEDVHAMPQGA